MLLSNMRRFQRPEISPKYGPCVDCGRGTRSHVIEPALYEEFEEEVIIGRSDDFATKKWEDVDTITKAMRVEEAVVMCHSCWLENVAEFNDKIPKIKFEGVGRVKRITALLHNVRTMGIEGELNSDAKDALSKLRLSLKGFLKGESLESEEE